MVIDVAERTLLSGNYNGNSAEINISQLPVGAYLLLVKSGNEIAISKFLKSAN